MSEEKTNETKKIEKENMYDLLKLYLVKTGQDGDKITYRFAVEYSNENIFKQDAETVIGALEEVIEKIRETYLPQKENKEKTGDK